jgi:plastocyanin
MNTRSVKVTRLLALAAASLLLVAACTSHSDGDSGGSEDDGVSAEYTEAVEKMDSEGTEDEAGETEITVDVRDNTFNPQYIEVSEGTTVRFVNKGRNDHNVLPVEADAFTPIEASELEPEGEGEITFDEAGDFPYYCSLHGTKTAGMIGGIRVVA